MLIHALAHRVPAGRELNRGERGITQGLDGAQGSEEGKMRDKEVGEAPDSD